LYRHAEDDGLINRADNPALKVPKPRRLPSIRRAVADTRLAEINEVAATTGNDPALDTLLLRLHTETACRRGGALALRPMDLDQTQYLVFLREKGETGLPPGERRDGPLAAGLTNLDGRVGRARPRPPRSPRRATAPLRQRQTDGQTPLRPPVGPSRPKPALGDRTGHLNFGFAVARAYAGHTDNSGNTTATYVTADISEVTTALAALTGESHPLAMEMPQ
jgi:hypothetical protein